MSDQKLNDTSVADKPLVTFALFAYNQEKYIREAVEAALGQIYEPLEIILSDDGSSDETFEIMQSIVADYVGAHKVILNRNSKNLNIGEHVNLVGSLASGELIVLAAGDDVSLPHRTNKLVEHWLAIGRPPVVMCSDFQAMDVESRAIDLQGETVYRGKYQLNDMAQGDVRVLGATTAVTKDIFTNFPPMATMVRYEDRVLPFRALLLGGTVTLLDEKLVWYRVVGGISRIQVKSARDYLYQYMPAILSCTLPDAMQRLTDLVTVAPVNAVLIKACNATIADHQSGIELIQAKGFRLDVCMVKGLLKGARPRKLLRLYLKLRFIAIFDLYYRKGLGSEDK